MTSTPLLPPSHHSRLVTKWGHMHDYRLCSSRWSCVCLSSMHVASAGSADSIAEPLQGMHRHNLWLNASTHFKLKKKNIVLMGWMERNEESFEPTRKRLPQVDSKHRCNCNYKCGPGFEGAYKCHLFGAQVFAKERDAPTADACNISGALAF